MAAERAPAPRIQLSGLEWKLLLAAALGAVYTVSWLAVVAPREAPTALAPPAPAAPAAKVSPARRPAVTVAQAARPRSRPATRIRTRSS
jgi:cytoskeletal protein RodZ